MAIALAAGQILTPAQQEEDIGGIIEKYRGILAIANQKLEDLELPEALARFTEVIDGYKTGQLPSATPLTRQIVGQALEGRARTFANLGRMGEAEADYEALVKFDPAWPVDRTRTSPKIVAVYDKVRARLIGRLAIQTEPPGASVSLDGTPIGRSPIFDREVAAGPHTLQVEMPGHEPLREPITVEGGALLERTVRLTRNTRGVLITTSPAGAQVSVGDQPRGVTFGTAGPELAAEIAALGLSLVDVSAPLLIENLSPGPHVIKVEKECHAPQMLSIQVALDPEDPSPLRYGTVRLAPSQGSIAFDSVPSGAEVLLDGKPAGRTPTKADGVCSGSHQVRMRHPEAGQWAGTVQVSRGERVTLKEPLRMTVAYVGMTEAAAGEEDLAKALAGLSTVALLAPGAGLPDEWRAKGRTAPNGTLPAEFISGVAAAPGAALVLAARPGEGAFEKRAELVLHAARYPALPPDRFTVRLDDAADLKKLISRLDTPTPLSRPWLGVRAIEMHRSVNPVAIRVQPSSPAAKSGVKVGDAIVSLGGKGLTTPRDLDAAVSSLKSGAQASLMLQTSGTAPRPVNVMVANSPMMALLDDPAQLYTRLAAEMSWRARAEAAAGKADSQERVTALLNLAIALMEKRQYDAALKDSLDRLNLPAGPGISGGTVAFLKGLCLKALDRLPEARQQLEVSAAQGDATIWTNDGPPVAERARRLLTAL